MALFILLVETNLFVVIGISIVIYFAVLIALKGFQRMITIYSRNIKK